MKAKYKTIKGLSRYIAKAAVVDEAFANNNIICSLNGLHELVQANEAKAKVYAHKIEQVLLAADGLCMSAYPSKEPDVLGSLEAICPNLHYGFAMQEQIMLTCAACGIKIYVGPQARAAKGR